MQSKNGLQNLRGNVKELDIIVHKNDFLIWPYSFLAIQYPTSPANLVVEVGARHSHQTLLAPLSETVLTKTKLHDVTGIINVCCC